MLKTIAKYILTKMGLDGLFLKWQVARRKKAIEQQYPHDNVQVEIVDTLVTFPTKSWYAKEWAGSSIRLDIQSTIGACRLTCGDDEITAA